MPTLNEKARALLEQSDLADSDEKLLQAGVDMESFLWSLPPVIELAGVAAVVKTYSRTLQANARQLGHDADYTFIAQAGLAVVQELAQRIAATLPDAERAAFLNQCGVNP